MKKISIYVFLLCMILSSCRKVVSKSVEVLMKKAEKETAEDVGKGTLENSVKRSAKFGVREGLKGADEVVLKNSLQHQIYRSIGKIPRGMKSIDVAIKNGKCYPAINNLGENAAKFSPAINEELLMERRKAVAPWMQFLTMDNINNIDIKKLILGKLPNADVLRKNMFAAMPMKARNYIEAYGGVAAHHIVEGTDKAALRSRKLLEKFGIDINHPVNGVFLGTDKNSIFKGTLHKTSHTSEYSNYVYSRLEGCKTKQEVEKVLHNIANDLYDGKIHLENNLHAINKNAV